MATYIVSYDIKRDEEERYNHRYASFRAQLKKCDKVWAEAASFAVVEVHESLEDFSRRLYFETGIDDSMDFFLVLHNRHYGVVAYVCGDIKDKALFELLPDVTKIGWARAATP